MDPNEIFSRAYIYIQSPGRPFEATTSINQGDDGRDLGPCSRRSCDRSRIGGGGGEEADRGGGGAGELPGVRERGDVGPGGGAAAAGGEGGDDMQRPPGAGGALPCRDCGRKRLRVRGAVHDDDARRVLRPGRGVHRASPRLAGRPLQRRHRRQRRGAGSASPVREHDHPRRVRGHRRLRDGAVGLPATALPDESRHAILIPTMNSPLNYFL